MPLTALVVLAFSIGQIVAQLIVLAAFHRTGHMRGVVVAIIVIGMTTIASGVVTLGGMQESNGNIIFAIITPIGAVLLLGRRAAVPTFIAFVRARAVGGAHRSALARFRLAGAGGHGPGACTRST